MMKRLLLLTGFLTTLLLLIVIARPAYAATSVFINEINYDTDGTDVGEAIEVAGPAGTDLTGWSIVLYNGSGGASYDTDFLSGTIPNQDNGYGTVFISYPSNGVQNGSPDGLALVDNNNTVIQFLSYEGTFTATNGPASGMTSTDIGVSQPSTNPVGFSLQLVGTGSMYEDFTWSESADDSFGQVNSGQVFGVAVSPTPSPTPIVTVCGDPATAIHEVQGSGTASPFDGSIVTIEGIVVGDFQEADGDEFNSDLDGFAVQEESSDQDALAETSEGIFVYAPARANVEVGDVVRVTGTVDEYFNLTEITSVTSLEICGNLTLLPDPVELTLPVDTLDTFEQVEGMLVAFPESLVISEYFNFDRYGEIVLAEPLPGEDRLYQPTAIEEPGSAEATARAAYNSLSQIVVDDARSEENPDPARHPNGDEFTLANRFRGGDTVQGATGVMDYRFDLYRLQPTADASYVPANPRTGEPEPIGGRLTVASYNVLNYFTTLGSRGANDAEEFERQRAKIIAALSDINPDVAGLIELENNEAAIQDLVSGLNDVAGAGTYEYIATGVIGSDEIKVGLIYKPAVVTPQGSYAVLDDPAFVDPLATGEDKNRPALAQTFVENESGAAFTVVVNHLKSKGSACGVGDDDPEQGNCTLTRTLAAEVLVDWLAGDPTASGDPDFLILGDLNSYDKEDPIDAVREGADDTLNTSDDYVDLAFAFQGEFAYSYLFGAQLGYLDYAMANMALLPQVTGTTIWHINSDEPDILDYDTTFKKDAQDALYEPNAYRSSDHDPVVVGLALDELFQIPTCGGQEATIYFDGAQWVVPAGAAAISNAEGGADIRGTSGGDVIVGSTGPDRIDGRAGNDFICGMEGNDILLMGNSGNDYVNGFTGNDLLRGWSGNDTLLGHDGNDHLYGDIGADYAEGGAGNDRVFGGENDDRLDGDGNAAISSDGGTGLDIVGGNAGNDACRNGDRYSQCEITQP